MEIGKLTWRVKNFFKSHVMQLNVFSVFIVSVSFFFTFFFWFLLNMVQNLSVLLRHSSGITFALFEISLRYFRKMVEDAN